ncbi:Short-chain dehydrogenase [Trichostrongylus colubriformis]|uniref:Short-chain dehydrogenase n=1 Tax=Trichostrongylus colubriformis TaxID=6319 RepID=A0AAN8G1H1_TRICO
MNFATTGCKLVLWDIDEKGNAETKQLCEDLGCEAHAYEVDLSQRHEIYTAAARVTSEIGDLDIVINNAGFFRDPGGFCCKSDDFIEKTIQVNMLAHMWMAKAFLPSMIERDSGHIVAVCSMAGIVGAKDIVDYSASKFGAFGFQEALENEMYTRGKRNIHFTTICTSFVQTRMSADIPVCPTAMLSAEVVAEEIFDAILTNERILLLPRKAYILYALKGLLPRQTFQRLLHYLLVY